MRVATIASVLLAVLSVAPALAADPDARKLLAADQKVQGGRKAFDAGDLAEARKQYQKALDLVPFQPDAYLGLGHILTKEKRFEEALAHYQKAEEGYARLAKLRQDQAAATDLERRQAIQDLGQTQDNRANVKASGGFERMQGLSTDTAIKNAQNAATPDGEPDIGVPGEAHFYTGTAFFQLGRVPEAMAEWKACAEKSPEFAPVYNNLALGYWKRGQLKEAVDSLDRAERLGFKVHPQLKADLHKAAAQAGVAVPSAEPPAETPAPAK